jgi:hypothetical protein
VGSSRLSDRSRQQTVRVAPLPARARLLHIGVPKSGTTSVQSAASGNRELLLAHGVRYPGRALNHKLPAFALLGRSPGWDASAEPPRAVEWHRLVREIESEPERRILLSHESFCEADDAQASRIADALGPRLHVVVTLRAYGALLASTWQQNVKSGGRLSFPVWLRQVLADPPDPKVNPRFGLRTDQGAMVTRWVRLLGADRVIAVVPAKEQPLLLLDAFADLLELPREVLRVRNGPDDGLVNRSLSLPEAELIRAVNLIVRANGRLGHAEYTRLVREGAVRRVMVARRPALTEPAVALPDWAARRAVDRARRHVDAITSTRCAVVGDLDSLWALPPTSVSGVPVLDHVPLSAAAEAVAGVLSAATGQRAHFKAARGNERPRAWPTGMVEAERITAGLASPNLLAVLAVRQYRAARRVFAKPVPPAWPVSRRPPRR